MESKRRVREGLVRAIRLADPATAANTDLQVPIGPCLCGCGVTPAEPLAEFVIAAEAMRDAASQR